MATEHSDLDIEDLIEALQKIANHPSKCGYGTEEPTMHSEDIMLDMRDTAMRVLGIEE